MRRLMPFWSALALGFAAALTGPAHAFSSYEHKELGDRGWLTAIAELKTMAAPACASLLQQPHLRVGQGLAAASEQQFAAIANGADIAWFSFGDLVSIYGDFAKDVRELNSSAILKRVDKLKLIVVGQSELDSEQNHMLELAATNTTHFAEVALDTYVKWHRKALAVAAEPGRLSEALHYEALGVHSYSDLFAVGHMMEDRARTQELLKWTETGGSWVLQPLRKLMQLVRQGAGSVLGLVANFYHNAFNTEGALVSNLDGDTWRAYGDNKYRIVTKACTETTRLARRKCEDPTTSHQRQVIDTGVAHSVLAVLKTAAGLPLAKGEALGALRKLPITYRETRFPVAMSQQKLRILQLIAKIGKSFMSNGFDFTQGILKYLDKPAAGTVKYAGTVKQLAAQ